MRVGHHRPRRAIYGQVKYIWPPVVPGDVELPARSGHLRRIHVRVENSLNSLQRSSDYLAVRIDDDAVARIEPLVGVCAGAREGESLGEIVSSHRHATAHDVDATLLSDVSDRREPRLAVIPRWSNVELHAPGKERVARERHVVLPADQSTHPANLRLVHTERAAV